MNRRTFLQAVGLGGVAAALAPAVRFASAAVARPVSAMRGAAGWANVRDFGAVGDGRTDDTAAIQDAIDSLGVDGTIWFPFGDYVVASAITDSGWRGGERSSL